MHRGVLRRAARCRSPIACSRRLPHEAPAAAAGPPRSSPPICFAHRGASGYAPENTIEAFRLALAQGADGIESDVWLSADGIPVLRHDRHLRVDGVRVDVTRHTARELARAGVPTLEQLYAECGTGFELSLDLEQPSITDAVLAVADAAGATEHLWLCHEDSAVLRDVRDRSDAARAVWSIHRPRSPRWWRRAVERLSDMGADALNLRWGAWGRASVDAIHEAGLLSFGWDAHGTEGVRRMLELGVDGIYSDFPDRLVEQVRPLRASGPG